MEKFAQKDVFYQIGIFLLTEYEESAIIISIKDKGARAEAPLSFIYYFLF